MKAFYSDTFVLPLPEQHRFPMAKYRLLRERILSEGILREEDLSLPDAISWDALRTRQAWIFGVAKLRIAATTPAASK